MGAAAGRGGRARRDLLLVAFCFVDVFAAGLAIGAIGPQMKEMGLGPATAGAVGSVYGTLQLASGPLAGWASDVFGRRAVLCGSCAGISLGYALMSVAAVVAQGTAGGGTSADAGAAGGRTASTLAVGLLIAARVVTGTSKHTAATTKALAADATRGATGGARAALLGRMNMGASLGYMVSPLLGAHMHSATGTYATAAAAAALCFAALVPLAIALTRPAPRAARSGPVAEVSEAADRSLVGPLRGIARLLKQPRVRTLFAVRLLLGVGVAAFRQVMGLLFTYHFDLNATQQGYVIAAFSLFGALAQGIGVGPVQRALGTERAYAAGLALLAGCYGAIATMPSLVTFVAVVPASAMAAGLARPLGSALLTSAAPGTATGQALSAADVIMSAARAVAPAAAGLAVAAAPEAAARGVPALAAVSVGAAAAVAYVAFGNGATRDGDGSKQRDGTDAKKTR